MFFGKDFAGVAQLARASGSYPLGRVFESLLRHFFFFSPSFTCGQMFQITSNGITLEPCIKPTTIDWYYKTNKRLLATFWDMLSIACFLLVSCFYKI